jgi:hypothetical protein
VQCDNIGLLEHLFEGVTFRIASRQNVRDVAEDHPHAYSFGEIGQLRAKAAVTDDAENEPPDFVRSCRRLVPHATMQFGVGYKRTAEKHDDLAQRKLGDRTAVAVRIIEDSDSAMTASRSIDLIDPDTKRADG